MKSSKTKLMMKQFIILMFSCLLIACGGETTKEKAVAVETPVVNELTPERVEKVQEVFSTIPSPMETANLFYSSGIEYVVEITNPSENVNKYVTSGKKALNLGVYGADLSYANVFDQSQESMIYINCSKKLSDGLDVSSAFDIATIERIEESVNNRDSLMVIIDDAFKIIEAHLNETGQDHLSALIMTGGWIEGLYLGTRTLDKENPDEELMKRIAAQKASLSSLMDLLITYDNTEVIAVENKMKALQEAFDKVDEKAINQEVIFEIADAAAQIRAKIIQ
ncbi:MAG: hypothetical protein P8Q14_07650 [Vicingaceae bacterium]|nr:hypothetical protein [Vicingaceae bacterium]